MTPRISAAIAAVLLAADAALTLAGNPDRDVSMSAAGELWADVLRDADQLGLQLTRVSAHDEMQLGARTAKSVLNGVDTSPAWEKYVREVGARLAPHVQRKDIRYEFHVIDGPIRNAFALPGGQVLVYTGMLEAMKSEAELASVLAHEIAHVDARHSIERFQYRLRLQNAGLGDLGELLMIARAIMAAGYAQYQELEADAIALRLTIAAGYDPSAGAELMGRLMRGELRGQTRSARTPLDELARLAATALVEYFQSHPPPPERMRRLEARIAAERKRRAGESFYRGVENFERRIPRSQREFEGEFIRL